MNSSPGSENWKDVMPYDPSVSLTGVLSFKNYLVLGGRCDGKTKPTHTYAHKGRRSLALHGVVTNGAG